MISKSKRFFKKLFLIPIILIFSHFLVLMLGIYFGKGSTKIPYLPKPDSSLSFKNLENSLSFSLASMNHTIPDEVWKDSFTKYNHQTQNPKLPCDKNYFNFVWLPSFPFYDYKLGRYFQDLITKKFETWKIANFQIGKYNNSVRITNLPNPEQNWTYQPISNSIRTEFQNTKVSFQTIARHPASIEIQDLKFNLELNYLGTKTSQVLTLQFPKPLTFSRQLFSLKQLLLDSLFKFPINKGNFGDFHIPFDPWYKKNPDGDSILIDEIKNNSSPYLADFSRFQTIPSFDFFQANPFSNSIFLLNHLFHHWKNKTRDIYYDNEPSFDFLFSSHFKSSAIFDYNRVSNYYIVYKIHCTCQNLEKDGLVWDNDGWIENPNLPRTPKT